MVEKYVKICPKCGSDRGKASLENINKRECLACGTVDFSSAFVEVPHTQVQYYRKESVREKVKPSSTSVRFSSKKILRKKFKKPKHIFHKIITAAILLAVIGLIIFFFR